MVRRVEGVGGELDHWVSQTLGLRGSGTPHLQWIQPGCSCSPAQPLAMAGGQGTSRGAASRREPGKARQLRPELRQVVSVVKTEETVVFKPRAQTIHKQLQVECSTVSVSCEPRLHAGMLAMQIYLCNRSQLSLPAVPCTG